MNVRHRTDPPPGLGHPDVFGKEDVMDNNNIYTKYHHGEAA